MNSEIETPIFSRQDRDLLIRLDQKVDYLHQKVSSLTDDHEKRIRSLEKKVWGASAIALVGSTIISYIIEFIIFHK